MDTKKKKRLFLCLLLLVFVSGWGFLLISRELPFSHDPIEDDSTVFRIVDEHKDKEKDSDGEDTFQADIPVQKQTDSGESIGRPKTDHAKGSTAACKENCEEKPKVTQQESSQKRPEEVKKPAEQSEEESKLNFHVKDEAGNAWKNVNSINIFANEEFEGKAIIAPESTGAYRFFIANEEAEAVKYHIEAREESNIKIPMLYRLKCNGTYVSDWKNAEEVSFDMQRLEAGKRDVLELEWKWKSSNADSYIGKHADQVQYHLYLRLQAEGVSS